MNLIKETSTANTTVKTNRDIKYIVVHYTAGVTSKSGTAKNTAKYFGKETTKASADFIVDDEFVVQFNPDIRNRYCWHAGGSKYATKGGSLYKVATSANSIGIEVCSTNDTGKMTQANDAHYSFKDAPVKNTIELVKYLMKEYNIDSDHVIRHYDINGKPCPGIIGWNADTGDETKWLDFKAELIKEETVEDTTPTAEPDKTKVETPKVTVGEVVGAIKSVDREPVKKPVTANKTTTQKSSSILDIVFSILKSIFKK